MFLCEKMKKRIYELGSPLGLNKKDIDKIIRQIPEGNEPISLDFGPYNPYYGTWYGTVSIYDF